MYIGTLTASSALTITFLPVTTDGNIKLACIHALLIWVGGRAVIVVALGACSERIWVAASQVYILDMISEGED